MAKIKLGVLIYTYDRIEDAKTNMDIVRKLWQKSETFSDIKIVHAYNGKKEWYPKKHIENDLVRLKNPGHFQGAAELIDAGIKKFTAKYADLDYVFVLAADTWLVKLSYVENIIRDMKKKELYLSTCAWGLPDRNDIFEVGMAVDLFVVDFAWAKKYKMFPIDYKGFRKRYGDLLLYLKGWNLMLEKLLITRYLQAIFRHFNDNNQLKHCARNKIRLLSDREPVHSHVDDSGFWIRKMHWPKMGLLTDHDFKKKKNLIKSVIGQH